MTLEIPNELVAALVDVTPEQLVPELKLGLILGLYQQGYLSGGKSSELLGISRWGFEELLAERKVARPTFAEDLEHDVRMAEEFARKAEPGMNSAPALVAS